MSHPPTPSSTSPVAERVGNLVGPVVATIGVELVDVEWTGGTLRVVVDGDGGITTEQLTEVNRLVSPLLDQHDPVPGRYLLEVSSPGVERRLRTPAHFRRAVGEDVSVKLVPSVRPRRVTGRLVDVDDRRLTVQAVEIDGVGLSETELCHIELVDVAKARTVFDWDSMPKRPKQKPRPRAERRTGSKKAKKEPKKQKKQKKPNQKPQQSTSGGDDGAGRPHRADANRTDVFPSDEHRMDDQ